MELENCINFLLAKAYQKVNSIFKAELKKYGITPVQFAVLYLLWKGDGKISSEISTALLLDNSTVTGIIDRLIVSEFIVRKEDRFDRRKTVLFLTDKGKEAEKLMKPCVEQLNVEVLSKFSEVEVKQLKKVLTNIVYDL